jgi:hypothetical protein
MSNLALGVFVASEPPGSSAAARKKCHFAAQEPQEWILRYAFVLSGWHPRNVAEREDEYLTFSRILPVLVRSSIKLSQVGHF